MQIVKVAPKRARTAAQSREAESIKAAHSRSLMRMPAWSAVWQDRPPPGLALPGRSAARAVSSSGAARAPVQATAGGAPAIVHELLRSPGQPPDRATRSSAEPRPGRDSGPVRVRADAPAVENGLGTFAPGLADVARFLADLEQRRRRVQSLTRSGTATLRGFPDPTGTLVGGYQLTQNFTLTLAPDARAEDYAIVQWIKGELYEQRGTEKVYWPADAGGALYGKSATDPWRFTDWIVDTPDADPRFGSHYGLTVTAPTTDFEDSPSIIMEGGALPAGLRYVVEARMGVYPWGARFPTTTGEWESQRPTPFKEVSWGWDITVDPDQRSLSMDLK